MKNSAILFASLLFFFSLNAQTKTASAKEVLEPVYAKAKRDNKNVLLVFHASWCGWCKKMDSSLNDAAIRAAIKNNYEVVWLDVYEKEGKKNLENEGSLELLTKMGGADQGLPYWLILDKDGNKLADSQYKPGQNIGCPATEEEVGLFVNILKQTSALNEAQLKAIEARFRKNDN